MATGYINLLPREDQREIRLEKLNSTILNFYLWVGVSLVVFAGFLFAGRIYLKSQLDQTKTKIELQRQVVSKEENQKLKKQLNEFNAHLKNLVNLSEHQGVWSEATINFARLVPTGVAIDTFVAERGTGKIRITGFAKTREAVLVLRDNLLSSEYFYKVNFPLANLTKPADLNFRYTFYVREEQLLQAATRLQGKP